MTTAAFNRTAGPIAQALNVIKRAYCKPPAYKPTADSRGTFRCTVKDCDGTIKFTVRASDGGTTGKCSSAGCLEWRE